jgi:hypothetical protein
MISVPMTVEACYMNKMEKAKIDKIAREVASANLHSASVVSVTTAPTTDSEGAPALTITITLTPGSTDSVSGEAVVKTISQLQERLQEEGEERFPIVEFETKGELPIAD